MPDEMAFLLADYFPAEQGNEVGSEPVIFPP